MSEEQGFAKKAAQRGKSILRRAASTMNSQGSPRYMNLLIVLIGAIGTYYLSPLVNSQFEAQKVRSDFVITNLGELRAETKDLLAALALFNQHIQTRSDVSVQFDTVLTAISRLQGQAISLYFVITDDTKLKKIADYQHSLADLMIALKAAMAKNADKSVSTDDVMSTSATANTAFIRSTIDVFATIGDLGGLKPEPGHQE